MDIELSSKGSTSGGGGGGGGERRLTQSMLSNEYGVCGVGIGINGENSMLSLLLADIKMLMSLQGSQTDHYDHDHERGSS